MGGLLDNTISNAKSERYSDVFAELTSTRDDLAEYSARLRERLDLAVAENVDSFYDQFFREVVSTAEKFAMVHQGLIESLGSMYVPFYSFLPFFFL